MQKFDRGQIVRFLHAVDHCLEADLAAFVIGGVASILGYGADVRTADIDVFTVTGGTRAALARAARQATKATGLDMIIDPASVADLPYEYEDRVRSVRGVRFTKLSIKVPDKYDLVLSKAARCHDHDLAAMCAIHKNHPLSEKTLVDRFESEIWKISNTAPRKFAFNMILVLNDLFHLDRERTAYYRDRWGLD